MQKIKILTIAFSICFVALAPNAGYSKGGIEFDNISYKDALTKAKAEQKLIFIDFYAVWCGPCKYLKEEVFTENSAGEYFNANFVNLTIDAEKYELDLVERIELDAYPTLVIFDSDGEILSKNVGAIDAEDLITFGRLAAETPAILSRYKENPNDFDAVLEYVELLSESDSDEASDIAESYLDNLERANLKTADAWSLIGHVIDYDSEIVDYVFENSGHFSGYDDFADYGMKIMNTIFQDAVGWEDLELLERAKETEIKVRNLADIMEHDESYYRSESDYIYYQSVGPFNKYISEYKRFVATYFWDDSEGLARRGVELAVDNYNVDTDVNIQSLAMTWADRSTELNANSWYAHFSKAIIQYYFDENERAMKHARKALELADENEKDGIQELIDVLE